MYLRSLPLCVLLGVTFICSGQGAQFKVVSLSAGNVSDLGVQPLTSTINAALEILSGKYPLLMKNYMHHQEYLPTESSCNDDLRGIPTVEPALANLYHEGVLDPHGPTMIITNGDAELFCTSV